MSNEVTSQHCGYRHCLTMAVASLCLEAGYESAQEIVVETLTEILQSCKYLH